MIKLEHVVLPSTEQMEFMIEGMRNPFNSWGKSDSKRAYALFDPDGYISIKLDIGPNDLSLMQKLSKNGPVHSKFMRMMPVMVRITAPLYWWKEFDTYKVGTVANSCSTMHKITEKEFTLDDFSREHLINYFSESDSILDHMLADNDMRCIISTLNNARKKYLECEKQLSIRELKPMTQEEIETLSEKKKLFWRQIIQLLPSSYNQTRNVMLDYEVLKNIYTWRKNHKLDEWVEFCEWIETLPYADIITGGKE